MSLENKRAYLKQIHRQISLLQIQARNIEEEVRDLETNMFDKLKRENLPQYKAEMIRRHGLDKTVCVNNQTMLLSDAFTTRPDFCPTWTQLEAAGYNNYKCRNIVEFARTSDPVSLSWE
jgi:hypothetical protein